MNICKQREKKAGKLRSRNKMRDDHIFFSLILTYQGMLYLILKFE
jgi:hypothetical protein